MEKSCQNTRRDELQDILVYKKAIVLPTGRQKAQNFKIAGVSTTNIAI
jgi:hypothetical protein